MLLTNHTLTGIALGLAIDQPLLLVPTAVASHLALDATPHFGFGGPKDYDPSFQSRSFIVLGACDFLSSSIITIAACLAWPERTVHILLGVLGCDLPDLTYIPIILWGRKRLFRLPGYRAMIQFFVRLQWYEHPAGLFTEYVWSALMLWLLWHQ